MSSAILKHATISLADYKKGSSTVEFVDDNIYKLLKMLFDYIDEVRCVKENGPDKEAMEAKDAIIKGVNAYGPQILHRACLVIRDAKNGKLHKIGLCLKGFEGLPYNFCISNEKIGAKQLELFEGFEIQRQIEAEGDNGNNVL